MQYQLLKCFLTLKFHDKYLASLMGYTGWPKKPLSSHYQESSLNRIKTVSEARFFINFEYIMNTRIL